MRTASATAGGADPPVKPRGGYRVITVPALAAAWTAYRRKDIRLADLRVWFACHEMDARRCRADPARAPRFGLGELRKLTGLSPRGLRDSLRRLRAARLLGWSGAALDFPTPADGPSAGGDADLRAFLGRVANPSRKVPVPRRTLRLVAGGARPALVATLLGHMIRGLYLKSGRCHGRGRVKASWIADTFGVDPRRVKQARRELIATGWLVPLEADQWALNRWGAHFRVNLDWSRPDAVGPAPTPAVTDPAAPATDPVGPIPRETPHEPGPELAPPPAPVGPELAPPESDKEPLNGREKNQEPAGGPAGVSVPDPTETKSEPGPRAAHGRGPVPPATACPPAPRTCGSSPPPRPPSAGKPDLRDVVPEDLKDAGRLLELYGQAAARGWATASERDRLRFVGAAEHARAVGTRNPCGLFVRLVRRGLWSFLTQDDEDAAAARLKAHLYGAARGRQAPRPEAARDVVALSGDARLVREVRAAAARAKYRGDAFPLLRRRHPEWTRERWDRGLAELGRDSRFGGR